MAIQSIGTHAIDNIDPSVKPASTFGKPFFLHKVTLQPENQHKTWQPVGFEVFTDKSIRM
jgi:hypothetical protein